MIDYRCIHCEGTSSVPCPRCGQDEVCPFCLYGLRKDLVDAQAFVEAKSKKDIGYRWQHIWEDGLPVGMQGRWIGEDFSVFLYYKDFPPKKENMPPSV